MTIRDIQRLMKPKAAQPIVKRIGDYLVVMRQMNKTPDHVALAPKDYDLIMRSVQSNKEAHEPEITGLRYDECRVTRGPA